MTLFFVHRRVNKLILTQEAWSELGVMIEALGKITHNSRSGTGKLSAWVGNRWTTVRKHWTSNNPLISDQSSIKCFIKLLFRFLLSLRQLCQKHQIFQFKPFPFKPSVLSSPIQQPFHFIFLQVFVRETNCNTNVKDLNI